MTDPTRDLDDRLARLAAATNDLRASAGFEDRVMQAILADAELEPTSSSSGWLADLLPASRFVLAGATLIAAVAVVFAVRSQRAFDDEAALALTAVEVGW